jgi:phosphatidylethanolamine/phosphatidyl-N-methylethanolamine N-methyltransferase
LDVSGTVEFDRIAPVYDETRRPPSEAEVRALVEVLSGARSLLDAGVGTGRFAVPLQAQHLEIVGVDLSIGMMQRARAKGIDSLIRADLRRLPLIDDAVDAAFTAHVLQLLPDPREVLRELGRVARRVVVVILPEWTEMGPDSRWRALRERYRELATELGYPLPERGRRYRHTLEELSAIATPKLVRQVEGTPSSASSLSESLARWEQRVSSSGQIPPEVHAEIVRRLQAEQPIDPSRWGRPRVERIVAWDAHALKTAA